MPKKDLYKVIEMQSGMGHYIGSIKAKDKQTAMRKLRKTGLRKVSVV